MEYRRADDELFGKYCYIDTPWIAGAKTRYRILGSGCESNTWCETPVTGKTTPVCHDSWEQVVFVVLDTLVSDDSIIRRFALKDIEVIEEADTPQPDCYMCKWMGDRDVCGRCRNRNLFAEADTEPQTERSK